MRKEFTVQSGMFIVGGGAAAAVAIVISGQCTVEYSIWNDTDIGKSAHSVSADSVLR